ncbi:MAG: Zn-ribbon domain-containing OB-fold protein [Acidimicrobiales bacterium]
MTDQIPLVDYLVLDDNPHLLARCCTACGARYFERRNACGACSATAFDTVAVPTEGVLRAFTIVAHAAPGVPVPFVAGIVDCDGTTVRGNVVNVEPDPDHVTLGMKVRLATYVIGTDDEGTEAVGFGFVPVERN